MSSVKEEPMRKHRIHPILALAAAVFLIVSCQGTTDAGITGLVKTKLAADSQVKASEITVETTNGVVTLTGNLDSQEAKDRALKLTRETSGVQEVKDMLSVRVASAEGNAPEPDRTLGEHIDDAAITMRVKARLLEDP